jgi:hypothetical protein
MLDRRLRLVDSVNEPDSLSVRRLRWKRDPKSRKTRAENSVRRSYSVIVSEAGKPEDCRDPSARKVRGPQDDKLIDLPLTWKSHYLRTFTVACEIFQ